MIDRHISTKIKEAAAQMPVVVVTGPRQSGKTTLIRSLFNQYNYANLENPEERSFAMDDPKGFLAALGSKAVIDEVQQVPALLSYIQVMVDEPGIKRSFILSGSQNLHLMQAVTQSLAGRSALFVLLPCSLEELKGTTYFVNNADEFIVKGFYPRIYDQDLNAGEWLSDYVQTYIERDVRQLLNITDLYAFRQFVEICAGRIGQLINFSEIGNIIGVSYQTAKNWLSVLEAGYIVYTLRPYHKNYNKRIVKSPKLYFYDTGIACSLLKVRTTTELSHHFAKGALFENFIINELHKNAYNRRIRPSMYFWNAAGHHEVDLLIESGSHNTAIEIKAGKTLHSDFFKSLKYFQEASGISPDNCFLVHGSDGIQKRTIATAIGWNELDQIPIL